MLTTGLWGRLQTDEPQALLEGPPFPVCSNPKAIISRPYLTVYLDPQCTSIKGLMVSIRWYLRCLKGKLGGLGGAGRPYCIGLLGCFEPSGL